MLEVNIEQLLEILDLKVGGVNKQCLIKYFGNISKEPIDFSLIPVDWIITTMIADFYAGADIDLPLSESFVSENFFCNCMSQKFGVSNPLIYHFAEKASRDITLPIVTLESRIAYYNKILDRLQTQFNNTLSDSEADSIQKKIDFFQSELEKLKSNGVQL